MDLGDWGELFGTGETGPLMMLVWIVPIILFVFYGQRIQLYITSGEIKKGIKKLAAFRDESKAELLSYVQGHAMGDPKESVGRFLDYFTVMPVDMDPAGIVEKVRHTVRSREDYTRKHVREMCPGLDRAGISRAQTLLEIASSLQLLHRVINHMYLTAKKQNNYPLILPLQMMMPFVMEQAEAMRDAAPAFAAGQPVGDGIGPMVVGKMMLGLEKEEAAFETVLSRTKYEGRTLLLLKAEGPGPTVGRPADALEAIVAKERVDAIIMVDAALKMEGEETGGIAHGFGAAIGGIGTERFQIERAATENSIPVFSIIVKQSVKEAITLMAKEIAEQAETVGSRVRNTILSDTEQGQTVLVIGVGNTSGVPQ